VWLWIPALLGFHRPPSRSHFLSKYQTLSKLFFQLTDELDRAVTEVGFQNFLLQPRALSEDPDLVPSLLRTRLEPEVERDLEELQAQCAADMGGGGGAPPPEADIERRILLFNAYVSGALERYEELRDEVLEAPPPPATPQVDTPPAAQALLAALAAGTPIPRG
jgi:hypothetical protein